ncbi:hypothetical protein QAD02_009098 [Eretmocerus hayati]|uniref:Uncharacterized protein n=1 Tax=Eretmocerus hayati TaxID=131215 RepID=A0ACC2N8B7_9HYME|nr:hypothetical protein QAD02_009098 [Eretmocerus hayati]
MWRDTILDPVVVPLFFTLYWKVRSNLQLAHHARTCLVQLASLNGPIMQNTNIHLEYLTTYMQSFLKLLSNIEIIDQEAIGIANIFKQIIRFFGSGVSNLPEDMQRSLVEQMTRLTCVFAEGASQEESMCLDDCLYMEAFNSLLETWLACLSDYPLFPEEYNRLSSVQIFNTYLQCHLSPPEGKRGTGSKELSSEEIDSSEEDDRTKFEEQLQIIGFFGRQVLSHSLPLLSRLLEDRTSKLKEVLSRLVGQNTSFNIPDLASIENLYEDLHWLVLISGHVLCMESAGETPLVPSEIMSYGLAQAQQGPMDLNATLQLLASPQSNISDINGAEQSADHTVRLIASVFRLSEVAKIAINLNAAQHLSPELCSTIIWFLHRWSLSYLMPKESMYTELSTTLLEAFGEDSPGCQWTFNFLIDKIMCYIKAFKGEPSLIKETMQLLVVLVDSTDKARHLTRLDGFGELVELATKGGSDLPQDAKRGLMRAIVAVGIVFIDTDTPYFEQVLQPLQERFKNIVCHADFPREYHQEQIRAQIMDLLEAFIGACKGVTNMTVTPIFQHTCNVLSELPKLLTLYHNYQQIVQLILDLFCECSKSMLYFLKDANSFLEICLNVVQAYANCNRNRLTVETTAEEDAFQDILSLMQLLKNLLGRDIFNMNSKEPGADPNAPPPDQQVQPINVFFYGLNVVMPMMTIDLLKFPSLCLQYFKMITFVCELHPDKALTLPPELLQQLLISVELGLYSFGREITILSCDIIQVLAKHIFSEAEKGRPKSQIMAPFLNLLMNLIITHQINSDLLANTGIPMYFLICCYQEQYQQLVQTLINEQQDQATAQRLANAFQELTSNLELNTQQVNRLKFRDNFDKFIIEIQGFLMVK